MGRTACFLDSKNRQFFFKSFVVCQEFHRNNRCLKTQGNSMLPPTHQLRGLLPRRLTRGRRRVSEMWAVGSKDPQSQWGDKLWLKTCLSPSQGSLCSLRTSRLLGKQEGSISKQKQTTNTAERDDSVCIAKPGPRQAAQDRALLSAGLRGSAQPSGQRRAARTFGPGASSRPGFLSWARGPRLPRPGAVNPCVRQAHRLLMSHR